MSEAKRQQNNYILAVLTSLAMFCMGQIPGSIDAAISKISEAFNLTSTTGLYVTTAACIVSVVFSIILGFVAGKKIGYRPLVLFCATVELVSALVPFFANNFVVLILLRGLFGIGFGGMQSMENTVTTVLIPVQKRASILGLGMFVGFGMNCILQFVGGVLADFGWNYVFLNHLILIIPYVVVVIGCSKMSFKPQDEIDPSKVAEESAPSGKLGAPVFQCWVMMLLIGVFIAPLLVGCSFLSEAIIPSATIAGVVAVFFSVGCMVGGLVYPHIFRVLGKKSLPIFLLLTAVGLVGCGLARSVVLLCIMIFIAGMGFSLTQTCAMMILGLVTSSARIALASALMMGLFNLGMFLSSTYEGAIGKLFGDALYLPLFVGAGFLVVIAVIYAVFSPMKRVSISTNKTK